jgi:transposase
MNLINISLFKGVKISFQSSLDLYGGLNDFSISFNEVDENKFKSSDIENGDKQTLLIDNINNNYFNIKNNSKNTENNLNNNFKQLVFDFSSDNLSNYFLRDIMVDYNDKKFNVCDLVSKQFNLEDSSIKTENNVLFNPDNRLSLLNRDCSRCGSSNVHSHQWNERKTKDKDYNEVVYYLESYLCQDCGKWFITPNVFKLSAKEKENIDLDLMILNLHANTGLSFDKIALVLKETLNINVSHQYIHNVVDKEEEGLEYSEEVIQLPSDFKKKSKTSSERGVSDLAYLYMSKFENLSFSGEMSVDEIFNSTDGKRYYIISLFANEIKNKPVSVAVTNHRHFDVMERFFKFSLNDSEFKALTSDMLGVYKKISNHFKVSHQQCIFHLMKYSGKRMFDEIKKEKLEKSDELEYKMLITDFREILRSETIFDAKTLFNKFSDKVKKLDFKVLNDVRDKLFKQFNKFTLHLDNYKVIRTTNKNETWNSLPQIRHLKNSSKNPKSLLNRVSSINKYYLPNYRTLKSNNALR